MLLDSVIGPGQDGAQDSEDAAFQKAHLCTWSLGDWFLETVSLERGAARGMGGQSGRRMFSRLSLGSAHCLKKTAK